MIRLNSQTCGLHQGRASFGAGRDWWSWHRSATREGWWWQWVGQRKDEVENVWQSEGKDDWRFSYAVLSGRIRKQAT